MLIRWIKCLIFSFTLCVSTASLYKNVLRHSEYDYIIVGAGTSGSVLANRLSEIPASNVLLLEAGGIPPGLSEIPLFSAQLVGSDMDWGYTTESQENACLEMKDRRCSLPRGKTLGGTSSINGMQYVRGEKRDFDEWAKGGAFGWSWNDILYYFKKAENQQEPELARTGYHGTKGYQTLSVSEYGTPLREAYFQSMEHLGYKMVDINSGSPMGYSKVQGTVRNGLRCSTEKAYLRPAASRENLDILINAHATKIIFDKDMRAESIRFEHKNVTRTVKAKKEIILSAGVYGSAQLLMLSGIGPREHLEELKIPVLVDLPVGSNLQDHSTVAGQVYVLNSTVGLLSDSAMNYQSLGDLLEGHGPLSVPASVECLAVINTKYQNASENWPDMRLFFASSLLFPTYDEKKNLLLEKGMGNDMFTVLPTIARPKSTGYVRLRSTDPSDSPLINPRYLTDEEDVAIQVEGMKMVEEIVSSPSLQKFGPVPLLDVIPGCENLERTDDLYYKCWARRLTQSSFHQCCTCKMGGDDDSAAVVDPQLRVKGVRGLRVADASIMPSVPSGNTMAPCIMIGEKAADLIKGKYWNPDLNHVFDILD